MALLIEKSRLSFGIFKMNFPDDTVPKFTHYDIPEDNLNSSTHRSLCTQLLFIISKLLYEDKYN
jgi:hypothetical protein